MRILLIYHMPLDWAPPGRLMRRWADALAAAGHDVHLMVMATDAGGGGACASTITCRPADLGADLPFDVPRFGDDADDGPSGLTFFELTDQQLAMYRDMLRRQLDALVDAFDPHVIHVQHVWVLGHLALETGVPYVLSAWPQDLAAVARDERYARLAEEAAANAGRILVPDLATRAKLVELFEVDAERVLLTDEVTSAQDPAGSLIALYQALLDQRFGGA